jgi:hypothetical protein
MSSVPTSAPGRLEVLQAEMSPIKQVLPETEGFYAWNSHDSVIRNAISRVLAGCSGTLQQDLRRVQRPFRWIVIKSASIIFAQIKEKVAIETKRMKYGCSPCVTGTRNFSIKNFLFCFQLRIAWSSCLIPRQHTCGFSSLGSLLLEHLTG